MKEKVLTVVVPVYKVEQYIDKCLSSLIHPDGQMSDWSLSHSTTESQQF